MAAIVGISGRHRGVGLSFLTNQRCHLDEAHVGTAMCPGIDGKAELRGRILGQNAVIPVEDEVVHAQHILGTVKRKVHHCRANVPN